MLRNAGFQPRLKTRRHLLALSVVFMIALAVFLLSGDAVWAQDSLTGAQGNVESVAQTAGVGNVDLITLIGRIIYVFLSLLGVIFLGLLLTGTILKVVLFMWNPPATIYMRQLNEWKAISLRPGERLMATTWATVISASPSPTHLANLH